MGLAKALRELRQERGLTQVELEERSGVAHTIISRLETGTITDPRISTVTRLARGLEVPVSKLIEETNSGRPNSEQILSVLRDHLEELQQRFHVREIALFGSAARGESGAESDVDLLVEYEPGHRDILNHSRLEEYLESLLERPVDLVMARSEGSESHPRIQENIQEDVILV